MPKKGRKSHYHLLSRKWLARHKRAKSELQKKHKEALEFVSDVLPNKEQLASGAVGVAMLASILPASNVLAEATNSALVPKVTAEAAPVDKTQALVGELKGVVPEQVRALSGNEETRLSQILTKNFGMNVRADIDGLRLNRTYGVIGAEQHLVRFPGDSMATHLSANDAANHLIYSSGMAPGRGAWGYFAPSKAEFGQKDAEREKWYIAVQTFLAPDYNTRLSDYRDFFKFRKMLVLNPTTGQAVVTDIGDAGPAQWTGKHLGGSPEVMYSLGFGKGSRKGPVLYFFIDDPSDRIPLGPIDI